MVRMNYALVRQSDLHGMIGLEAHAIHVIQYRFRGYPALEVPWEVAFIDWWRQASHHSDTAFHCRPDICTWSMD